LILIDSSGWLDFFTYGPLADTCETYIEGDEPIVVPTVVLYEVYKTLRRESSEEVADEAAFHLSRQRVVPLDGDMALAAAEASLAHGLPFADAVIYATATIHEATVFTSDAHFAALEGVQYIPKPAGG
jgi:predicted nucleic acid-binding protein